MNFGGIAPAFTVYKKAAFVVIPVPYDLTSTYQSGSRRGPGAILEGLRQHGALRRGASEGDLSVRHPLPCRPSSRMPADRQRWWTPSAGPFRRVAADGKTPVMLGGEHSISFGAVQAMKEIYPEITVLQLDAHADLRDAYQGDALQPCLRGPTHHRNLPLIQAA